MINLPNNLCYSLEQDGQESSESADTAGAVQEAGRGNLARPEGCYPEGNAYSKGVAREPLARERVFALVSGFPSRCRNSRWLFVLQVCIDDSGNTNQGQTCLLAGFAASVEAWADFSDRWDAVLRESPAIPYFKMSNAFARRKEFEGWTTSQRDAKVDRLAQVIIETPIIYGCAVAMKNADYLTVAKGATNSFLNDPIYFLFTSIMQSCLLHQLHNGIFEKVDFVFDSFSKPAKEIDALFRQTMFTGFDKIKALQLADNPPILRDEKTFLPLQAADLLAGQIRSWQERGTEPEILKKLGSNGLKINYNIYDAKQFDVIVKGTRYVQEFINSGKPGEEVNRFEEMKRFIEANLK